MKQMVGVIGGRSANTSAASAQVAEAVGRAIARRNAAVICGGDDGIGQAACRGCKEAGGVTLAVLKWNHAEDALPEVDYAIPTSIDLARNNIIIWAGSGIIAFEGRYGTTSELTLALDVQKPIVVVGETFLLREDAFDVPWCARFPRNDPGDAEAIVGRLFEMIARTDAQRAVARNGRQP